jgi:hypothetical protein
VPLPVAGHLQRVDREHAIAGRDQRLHPRPPFGLDPHHDLIRLTTRIEMLGHQLVQCGDPGQALRQPPPDQQPTSLVLNLDVVMGLSPVIADEQHCLSPPSHDQHEPRRRPAAT